MLDQLWFSITIKKTVLMAFALVVVEMLVVMAGDVLVGAGPAVLAGTGTDVSVGAGTDVVDGETGVVAAAAV
jgi:hypothetical protein